MRSFAFTDSEDGFDEAALLTLAADLASHAHLRRLELSCLSINTAAALDAVVDAALMRQLTHVTLQECDVSTVLAPALVRLIGSGALAELDINGGDTLVDVPAALAVGNALRASCTLTTLSLRFMDLWRDPAAATALLGALTGHPSLHSLDISENYVNNAAGGGDQAGALIAALVAANAPALMELHVSCCRLFDAGLGSLLDALPANTHLRTLSCGDNEESEAFVRERLLPAVRANSSLRQLDAGREFAAAREAQALVQRRAANEAAGTE